MFSHHLRAHFSCVQLCELHWRCSCPGLRRAAPSSSSLCKLPARRMSWHEACCHCSFPGLRRAAPSSSSLCKPPARRMSWQRQRSRSAAGEASLASHLGESADASMVLSLTQGMHKAPYSLGSCCCRWVDQLLAAAMRQSKGGPLQTPNTEGHLLALSPLGKTLLADPPC